MGVSYTNTRAVKDRVREQEGRSVVRGEGEKLSSGLSVLGLRHVTNSC